METNHVVSLISRVRAQANALLCTELEKRGHVGLAPSHGAILRTLAVRGPQPMSALADAIGKQKNTVTTLVGKLERVGYVVKTPSPDDSRVSMVALSAKAQAAMPDFEAISQTLLAALWGNMPQQERETLVRGLEQVLRNISAKNLV